LPGGCAEKLQNFLIYLAYTVSSFDDARLKDHQGKSSMAVGSDETHRLAKSGLSVFLFQPCAFRTVGVLAIFISAKPFHQFHLV
jgi:hypothetical protein